MDEPTYTITPKHRNTGAAADYIVTMIPDSLSINGTLLSSLGWKDGDDVRVDFNALTGQKWIYINGELRYPPQSPWSMRGERDEIR